MKGGRVTVKGGRVTMKGGWVTVKGAIVRKVENGRVFFVAYGQTIAMSYCISKAT